MCRAIKNITVKRTIVIRIINSGTGPYQSFIQKQTRKMDNQPSNNVLTSKQ